jgi:hypothetical protein
MDVVSTLVAHFQPPEAVDPRERSFHRPPVSAQFLARVDAPPRYARGYASLSQRLAASGEVLGLVSMELLGGVSSADHGEACESVR